MAENQDNDSQSTNIFTIAKQRCTQDGSKTAMRCSQYAHPTERVT